MPSDFVHLHNHSDYSFLDGAIKIGDMVAKAVEFGMPALALTDHGGLFGAVKFYNTCHKAGINPVLGFEAYMAPRSRLSKIAGDDNRNSHIILLAENNEGWKNCMYLSSIGYLDGFYYKPRIDKKILREYSKGIIATSACIAGEIPRALNAGDRSLAKKLTEEYLDIFGEGNFFFELQKHGLAEEESAYPQMIELGNEMGVPFIVANDAHYLTRKDAKVHEVLLCIQSNDLMSNPNRFKFQSEEVYFKSPDEMAKLFPEIPEAMSNTVAIAKRCEVSIKHSAQLPVPEMPDGVKDLDIYLKELAEKGMKEKYSDVTPEIRERLDYELGIIISMGFSGYFLIVLDFLLKADELGIMRGCRGSAAGSLVAYSIGITNVDPIKFDLIFERFLNPERISMPDVDADIADSDRYQLIDYVVDKYGRESVCQIINFGRMKAKAAVKDVARVMGVLPQESQKLSNMIKSKTIQKSIDADGELKSIINGNSQYQEIIKYAKGLEGLVRQPGLHAGGVIIAPKDVRNWAPLFKQSKDNRVMTQFDMGVVEDVGLIKMDFLGLRTLTVLQETLRLIEQYHENKINLWKIEDCDHDTYKLFHDGETTDIFQFESSGMQDYLRKLKPTCIEDIIAMAALYRPGPMKNIGSFIRRKHGEEEIVYAHEILKDILDVTYGIIVYQEQVMRIAQKMGGFTLGQADILRKAMGKKDPATMLKMKASFVSGAIEQSIDKKIADDVWAIMEMFAEYGFNKAHACVYAHVSYQAAYLKSHYSIEYMTAVLTSHIGDKEKFLTARNEAKRLNLKVDAPDINKSELKCNISDGAINIGLKAIANVGKAAEAIINNRDEGGKFSSIFDFCSRVDLRLVNKKSIESLIYAGALDSLPGTRAQLIAAIENAINYGNSIQKDRESGQISLFGDSDVLLSIPEPQLPEVPPMPYADLLNHEKDVMNFYVSGHPLETYSDEIHGFASIKLNEDGLSSTKNNCSVLVGGVITKVKTHISPKGQMAFIVLEDFNGEIEMIAFYEVYGPYSHLCAVDSMVLVRGKIQKENVDDVPKIIISKMMPLSEVRETLTKSIHITLCTQGLEESFIKEIYSICDKYKGRCKLIIHLITAGNNEYRIQAKNILTSPSHEMIKILRKKLGETNVRISPKTT